MNKLAIRETFPPGIVGREIVLAQMCHHYRRICRARARVDSNLQKPKTIRFLTFEETSFGQRTLTPRTPPKHRRCLKYEVDINEQRFKPSIRSQRAESQLRLTPKIYHPPIKSPRNSNPDHDGHQQATQTSLDNSLIDNNDEKMKDEASQTYHLGLYRPLDVRSVHFIRDVINEALRQRAFTSSSINRIFREHQLKNVHDLTHELMEKELDELRRQLGMLPRHRNGSTVVSDNEALDALDTLVMDPNIKEQVIHSLRLTRTSESKKPVFLYFDRLVDNEIEESTPLNTQNIQLTKVEGTDSLVNQSDTTHDSDALIKEEVNIVEENDGWDAEIQEEQEELSTSSAPNTEDEEQEDDEQEEDEAEGIESEDEVTDLMNRNNQKETSSNYESAEDIEVNEEKASSKEIQENNATTSDKDDSVADLYETEHHNAKKGPSEEEDEEEESDAEQSEEDIESEINSEEEILSEYDDNEYESQTQSNDQISNTKTEASNKSNIDSDSEVFQSMKNATSQPMLQTLKLESSNSKDKWRSSLEAVQEECDSTIKDVSEISSSSAKRNNADQ